MKLAEPSTSTRPFILSSTLLIAAVMLLLPLAAIAQPDEDGPGDGWITLFNGENLDGWTPKITGSETGVNYRNTFRVEGGALKVSYDRYDDFNGDFGHLFYEEPFSHFLLRLQYRFTGDQVPGGPGWAFRNSGVMVHSQPPESMRVDQEFPVSVEVQLLGGNGTDERTTANICTPGTHVVIDGELVTRHCINSSSQTYHGDRWVNLEIEVRGNKVIRHRVNGELVFEYGKPRLDDSDPDAQKILDEGRDPLLDSGYICVQAESHPVEFRNIVLKRLE